MSAPNLIVGGEINLVTLSRQVWGETSRMDGLGPFFKSFFEEVGLIYVEPIPIGTT